MKVFFALWILVWASVAHAQEPVGGMRSFLTVGAGFVWDDNPDFSLQRSGEFAPMVELRFGLTSETRMQSFAITGGLDVQGDEVEQGLVDLSYGIHSAQSKLGAELRIDRLSSGSFDGALEAGTAKEGNDVVELLPRGGTATTIAGELRFETGLQRNVGYELGVSRERRNYAGTVPRDVDQAGIEGGIVLRFSKLTVARVTLDRTWIRSTGAALRVWESNKSGVEISHQIDPITRIAGGLGYRRISGTQAGTPLRQNGAELNFNLTRELSNGEIFASVELQQQSAGRRGTLRFGLERYDANSVLSAWAGVTKLGGASAELIGGVSYDAKLEQTRIGASLERRVTAAPDSDDTRLTDRIGLEWDGQLTLNGRLNLRADYLRTDASFADVERNELRLQAVYRHDLREDWGVKAGLRWRARQDAGSARAQSRSVFLTFEKQFEALH